jgi:hypothetical protein
MLFFATFRTESDWSIAPVVELPVSCQENKWASKIEAHRANREKRILSTAGALSLFEFIDRSKVACFATGIRIAETGSVARSGS